RVLYRGLLGARGHGADALPTTPDPRAMLRARVWCLSGLRLPRPSCPLGRRRRVSSSTLRAREKDPLRILVARGRPPDSHPPRAPARSISAPTAAVRPLRLRAEVRRAVSPSQADAAGVSARRYLAPAQPGRGSRWRARPAGKAPRGHPGPPIVRSV